MNDVKKKYRVLIVDDKKDCLDMAKAIIRCLYNKDWDIEINPVHTRRELFNDTKFEVVKEKNEGYYIFILAKYLEKIIMLDISNNIFCREISDTTYVKIKRTSTVTIIGLFVLLCSLLGACTQFFGGLILESFQKKELLTAFVFIFFTLFFIILGGRLVLYVIEKILPKWLNNNT